MDVLFLIELFILIIIKLSYLSEFNNNLAEPRQRPKLQLQPRTKPVEPIVVSEDQAESSVESKSTTESESTQRASAPTSLPPVNIFGAAKPVDTTAREREIEERLAKSYAESRSREEMYV